MTRYTYRTTITVTVDMEDEGGSFEGEPVHWEPGEQERSAREFAEQAMPLDMTYPEDWVEVDAPPLQLISTGGTHQGPQTREQAGRIG